MVERTISVNSLLNMSLDVPGHVKGYRLSLLLQAMLQHVHDAGGSADPGVALDS